MKINNKPSNQNFRGIMQYETHIVPRSAAKKLRQNPKAEEWMFMKNYNRIFETTPQEDAAFTRETNAALQDDSSFALLNKRTSKGVFKVLENITFSRKLPIFCSHIWAPTIKLAKTTDTIIYDDLEFFRSDSLEGTGAILDLRTPQKIKDNIKQISSEINARNYVSDKTKKILKKINSNLNKYNNVNLFKAEQKLRGIGPEWDESDLPF